MPEPINPHPASPMPEDQAIRERVKGLTSQVLKEGRINSEAVSDIVRTVMGGGSGNAAVSSAEAREQFAAAIRDLDVVLVESASATHEALQQLASRGKDFTENDLKEALASLRQLEQDYAVRRRPHRRGDDRQSPPRNHGACGPRPGRRRGGERPRREPHGRVCRRPGRRHRASRRCAVRASAWRCWRAACWPALRMPCASNPRSRKANRLRRWSPGCSVLARDLPRLREISSVLIRHGLGDVVRRAGVATLLERAGQILQWGAWPATIAHLEPQQRMRLAFEELGPTFVKLGQMLSTREDLLPPAWTDELERLHSRRAAGALRRAAASGRAGARPVPVRRVRRP